MVADAAYQKAYQKAYREARKQNPELLARFNAQVNRYMRNRYKTDPEHREKLIAANAIYRQKPEVREKNRLACKEHYQRRKLKAAENQQADGGA